ncbi:hypothetical protein CR513_30722, partial [Mucuna pruriens]
MDPNNLDKFNKLWWHIIEEELMDNIRKEYMRLILECQRSPKNNVNDYIRIGESTIVKCLQRFVKGVNDVFGFESLRRPNNSDIEHLLHVGKACDFLDMLDFIDCMH